MLLPLVLPEVVPGSVQPDVGPLSVELGLDRLQGRGVERKGGVAFERTLAVAGRRPDAVDGPAASD